MYQPPIRPNEIYHYGIKRRSGRYPWGSGERPYQSMSNEKLIRKLNQTQQHVDALSAYERINKEYEKMDKGWLEKFFLKAFHWNKVLNDKLTKKDFEKSEERMNQIFNELKERDVKLNMKLTATLTDIYSGTMYHLTTKYEEKKD